MRRPVSWITEKNVIFGLKTRGCFWINFALCSLLHDYFFRDARKAFVREFGLRTPHSIFAPSTAHRDRIACSSRARPNRCYPPCPAPPDRPTYVTQSNDDEPHPTQHTPNCHHDPHPHYDPQRDLHQRFTGTRVQQHARKFYYVS